MINEIMLSIIQSAAEFLPISSSGHLALVSKLFNNTNIFFITLLHLASLIAVIFFLRKEIFEILKLKKESRKLLLFIIIATIPGALAGLLFKNFIESAFSSFLLLGICFIFTGFVLLSTKFIKTSQKEINIKNSILIGLFQALALLPGISRSGMTISSALISGIEKEKAARFSFLLFIPLSLGAFLLELKDILNNNIQLTIPITTLIISFVLCSILSFLFLNLLVIIIKKEKFWMFSFYCFLIGALCFYLNFLK